MAGSRWPTPGQHNRNLKASPNLHNYLNTLHDMRINVRTAISRLVQVRERVQQQIDTLTQRQGELETEAQYEVWYGGDDLARQLLAQKQYLSKLISELTTGQQSLETEERELTQINQRLQAKLDALKREPYSRELSQADERELAQVQQRVRVTLDDLQRERVREQEPRYEPLPPGRPRARYRNAAPGERNTRRIPQDVIIAVSDRDGGRCVYCASREDLHFDHIIPWSKGGANTVNNIQLLCGRCNRAKGAR